MQQTDPAVYSVAQLGQTAATRGACIGTCLGSAFPETCRCNYRSWRPVALCIHAQALASCSVCRKRLLIRHIASFLVTFRFRTQLKVFAA